MFFKALEQKDVTKIAELQLHKLVKRLADNHISLIIQSGVAEKLAELGYEKSLVRVH